MRVRLVVCSAPLSVPSSGASTDTLLPAVPAPPPLPAVAAAEPGGVQPLPPAGEPLPLVPDVPVPAVPPSPCGSIIAEAGWGGLRNAVFDFGMTGWVSSACSPAGRASRATGTLHEPLASTLSCLVIPS